jgi:hypothetical protein
MIHPLFQATLQGSLSAILRGLLIFEQTTSEAATTEGIWFAFAHPCYSVSRLGAGSSSRCETKPAGDGRDILPDQYSASSRRRLQPELYVYNLLARSLTTSRLGLRRGLLSPANQEIRQRFRFHDPSLSFAGPAFDEHS